MSAGGTSRLGSSVPPRSVTGHARPYGHGTRGHRRSSALHRPGPPLPACRPWRRGAHTTTRRRRGRCGSRLPTRSAAPQGMLRTCGACLLRCPGSVLRRRPLSLNLVHSINDARAWPSGSRSVPECGTRIYVTRARAEREARGHAHRGRRFRPAARMSGRTWLSLAAA